jgi:hypothetical protein
MSTPLNTILQMAPGVTLTRQGRRRLGRLMDDRRFFERHPNRTHRVRLASRVEVETQALLKGVDLTPAPGSSYYVAVRQEVPGLRLRLLFATDAGNETDVSEEEARFVFEWFSGGSLTNRKEGASHG